MKQNDRIEEPCGVAVYCASSSHIDPKYAAQARLLGEKIAQAGLTLVSGGGRAGLMAAAIEGAHSAGGRTVGVIPQFMVDRGWDNPSVTETVVTESMQTRKETMAKLSRGVIALPGGCGTLDELFEMITLRQLGLYRGQIVIVNTAGYYDPLIEMLDKSVELGFMNPDHRRLWYVTTDLDEAVARMLLPPDAETFSQKLEDKSRSSLK